MTPSLIIGDGNWAVKSDSLLGYKIIDGKYYPREMTFTRATTGTRVNAAGLVELVPYNLLSYSEEFENAAWTKSSVTIIPNDATAPNGTLTADKLYPTSSGNFRHVRQSAFSPYTGLNTMSIYAKKAELSNLTLIDYDGSGAGINFNLNTGVATDYATTPFVSYSMTDVGNGWYRCTATALNGYFYWMVTDGGNSVAVTANGTDGIYIWGAQLVEGTQPLDYLPTTDRLDIPRVDYSTGSSALLLEPQRTNLALQSASFENASWTKTFGGVGLSPIVTANAGISPDGLNTADRIQFNLNGGTAVGDVSDIRQLISTTATSHTFSFYAKSFDGISTYNMLARDANGFVNAITVTSTWTRFTITATYAAASSTIGLGLRGNQSPTNPNTADILIWGAQLEAGSYATSYIPTTSASVTRNADSVSKTGISSLIGQTEGTIFLNMNNLAIDSDWLTLNPISGSPYTNSIGIGYYATAVRLQIYSPSGTAFGTIASISGNNKIALGYKSGDIAMYINGVNVFSSSNAFSFNVLLDSITVASQSWLAGSIAANKIYSHSLYTTRLTNSELAQLTTP